jgi:hypothetical protein
VNTSNIPNEENKITYQSSVNFVVIGAELVRRTTVQSPATAIERGLKLFDGRTD